jgi:hypothetical protein
VGVYAGVLGPAARGITKGLIGDAARSGERAAERAALRGEEKALGKAEKPSSQILGRNLKKADFKRGDNEAAHHIVAGTAKKAAPARAILRREGIGINDADNGVFLPYELHYRIHTNVYYAAVNREITNAAPGTVRDVLAGIRRRILAGTFPY